MNKNLKAQIVKKYGAQYKFARALDIQETIVRPVIQGRKALDDRGQKHWAKVLKCKPQDIFDAK